MKHILFVDDEPQILKGLERMLFPFADEWDMTFVESGQEALRVLGEHPFDVLVTDLRMPGMDGAQLLQQVSDRHPQVVRIVLSGHGELEQGLRLIPVAHQFLGKPCKPDLLRDILDRACDLRDLLLDENLRALASDVGNLPARPHIFTQLLKVLANDDATLDDVADVVENDIVISGRLLQIVNSAFFGANQRVLTVRESVARLGTNAVQSVVLALSAYNPGAEARAGGLSADAVHQHGLLVGSIAKRIKRDHADREDAFLAGMLHDIGKLTLAAGIPEYMCELMDAMRAEKRPMHALELERRGVTHAEIGAYLLGLWGLPYPVIEAVARHHLPPRPGVAGLDLAGTVYVANLLAHELAGADEATASLDEAVVTLGIADQIAEWRDAAGSLAA